MQICVSTYVRRSQYRSVPVAHEQILAIFQAITACLGAKALFALLELLQQPKIARYFCRHDVTI